MKRDFIKYLLGLLLFGSNGVVASYINLPSHDIVLLRSALGAILLITLFFLTGGHPTIKHHKKDSLYVFLSGIAMAADWLLLFESYARIGVSLGMIINYCGPVLVILFSAIVFKEKITTKTIIALCFALAGAILISWQGINNGIDRLGLFLAILSAFAYAAMVILNKLSREIEGTENSVLQLVSTLLVVAIFVSVKHGIQLVIPSDSIFPVLWIGLINTGIGCFLYFSSIGTLSAQTVAICGYLEPLSAVFFSAVILHERLLSLQIIGTVLILAGTLIVNTRKGNVAISK